MAFFASGFTTAAGIIASFNDGSTGGVGGGSGHSVLRGFSVSVGTTVASTVPIMLHIGRNADAPLSSQPIMPEGVLGTVSVSGLHLHCGYAAISSTNARATGIVATLFGD